MILWLKINLITQLWTMKEFGENFKYGSNMSRFTFLKFTLTTDGKMDTYEK
jgi:hypothetical protein